MNKKIKVIMAILFCLGLSGCDNSKNTETFTIGEYKKAEQNYLKSLTVLDYGNFIQNKEINKEKKLMSTNVNIVEHYAILKMISDTPEQDRKSLENLSVGEIMSRFEDKFNIKIPHSTISDGFQVPLYFYLESEDIRNFSSKTIPSDKYKNLVLWINYNINNQNNYEMMKDMTLDQILISFYLYENVVQERENKKS